MIFSTNPFPHLSFTSTIEVFPPSNSFLDHEKHDLYLHQICNNPNPIQKSTTSSTEKDVGLEQYYEEYDNLFLSAVVKSKKSFKKDHHSKIHTAKGPKDRRVRLSFEVAKRFFYLQDLLGFDKGSKTLDWLFNKSKISIDELIRRKKQTSSSTATDQSEVIFLETTSDEQIKGSKKKCGEAKRKKIIRDYKSAGLNQSRAEARARARERTKKKLKSVHVDYCSPNLTLQYSSFWNSVDQSQNDYNDKIVDSVMEDNISFLYSYHHNNLAANNSSSKFTCLPKFTNVGDGSWPGLSNDLDPLEPR